MAPESCPNCAAEVPAGARACPECGADEETGWSQSAHCDRLGIPDPDEPFDYGEFVRDEFGGGKQTLPGRRSKTLWLVVAAVLLVVLFFWSF